MRRFAILGLMTAALAAPVVGGEFNKQLNIGDAAPTFKSLPSADGQEVSLSDFADKDVMVVCVTCNHCPVAVLYEDRLIDLAKKYATGDDSRVAVVAVSVSNMEADSLPKMKERSDEKGFNFPYIYDETQELGRALGASVTPEFFVFDKNRKLVYMGALDDSGNKPTTNYVADAIEAALKGEPAPQPETRARGCGVRYESK